MDKRAANCVALPERPDIGIRRNSEQATADRNLIEPVKNFSLRNSTRGASAAARSASAYRGAAHVMSNGVAAYYGGEWATHLAAQADDIGWMDLLPGFATYAAGRRVVDACR